MRIFIALEPGTIIEGLPKLDMLLDEVLPAYDLTGVVDWDEDGGLVEFITLDIRDDDETLARKAIRLAFGEPLVEKEIDLDQVDPFGTL